MLRSPLISLPCYQDAPFSVRPSFGHDDRAALQGDLLNRRALVDGVLAQLLPVVGSSRSVTPMVLPLPLVTAGAVEVLRDAAGFAAYWPSLLMVQFALQLAP